MSILFVLIPLSLVLLLIAIWGFFWMVKNRQFDDLDSVAWRILQEEPEPRDRRGNQRRD